jgi:hypothetical protein
MLRLSVYKVLLALAFMWILCTPVLIAPARSFPGDKPAFVVEPTIIKDPTLTPGSTFTISIMLYNVTSDNTPAGLLGVEVKLTYDNTILNITRRWHKLGADGGVLNPDVLIAKNELGPGYYWLAGASMGDPWWGNGIVAILEFKVLGVGKSNLELSFTELRDLNNILVLHYVESGVFDNRAAMPTAHVYVDPMRIVDSSLAPSNEFYVNISVVDAAYLAYFAFNLSFNNAILDAIEARWGWTDIGPYPLIDNLSGVINGSSNIDPPITGNSTLVIIKFHVKDLGEGDFHLFGLTLLDSWGDALPFTTTDGYFNNLLITRIFVDPPYRMDPNLRPGNTTSFGIVGENFNDVKCVEFDLLFNPAVIRIIGYLANPINGYIVDPEITVINSIGKMHAKLTYDPPVFASVATIMNITFQIVGFGVSSLDLNDTTLTDSFGNPISHQAEDGMLVTVIRDIAIIDIQPVPQKVYPGRIITIYVVARNLGNLSESFMVSAYVDGTISLGTLTVTDLPPNTNATLIFSWDTSGLLPCQWHVLSANASILPFEINVSNNALIGPVQVKIKIFGDIDGDGIVGLSDLITLAQAYNSVVGDPKYNPDADLDGNGRVSLADLVTCAKYYNASCS